MDPLETAKQALRDLTSEELNSLVPFVKKIPTLADFIKKAAPEQFARFHKAPWDWKVFFPCNMDEEMTLSVYLHIGKKRKKGVIYLSINLVTGELISSEEDWQNGVVISASCLAKIG